MTASDSRGIVEPLVLQIASTFERCVARVPDRLQGVGGLAGLADRDDQRGAGRGSGRGSGTPSASSTSTGIRVQCSMAYFATMPGVERRAAGDDDDLVDVAQLLVGEPHLVELQRPVGVVPAEQRVGDRARLLEDLLAHEPVVAVLLGGRQVPVDVVAAGPRPGVPSKSVTSTPVAGDRDDLVLAELERLAGVLDERRDVGAEEVLAVAEPDDQRRVAARRDDPRRVVRRRRRPG